MSLRFSGWEVTKLWGLKASQRPTANQVYTMYHGTSVNSARSIITGGFRQSTTGMLGPGVYVSRDMKKAEAYPRGCNSAQRVILEVSVSVGRVKRIDRDNHKLQYTWHDMGYDTAWVPPNCGMKSVPTGFEEDCVYDPKNVQVVGIAQAPNAMVLEELIRLLAEKQPESSSNGGGGGAVADLLEVMRIAYLDIEAHDICTFDMSVNFRLLQISSTRPFAKKVHCHIGVSRSATMLKYLMLKQHLTRVEAICAVKENRGIYPN